MSFFVAALLLSASSIVGWHVVSNGHSWMACDVYAVGTFYEREMSVFCSKYTCLPQDVQLFKQCECLCPRRASIKFATKFMSISG